jgi:hypothetical protein
MHGQGILYQGHHDKMHVVAHQAAGKNIKTVFFYIPACPGTVKGIIASLFNYIVPIVPALSNVVGNIWYNDA